MNQLTTDSPSTVRAVLWLGVWSGMVAAGLELLTVLVNRHLLGQFAFVGRDVWWTVPLVNAALFGAASLPLVAAARVLPLRVLPACASWTFGLLMSLGVLLNFTFVHRVAALILAVGIATNVARSGVFWRPGTLRLIRRTTPWLIVLAASGAVAVRGQVAWTEQRGMSAAPAPAGSPNVLVIVLDTVRAASLSLYGHSSDTTPQLRQWAEGGVVFDMALSTAPWTLPAHASLLTGRWATELSTDWMRPLDDRVPTLSEALSVRGYATAAFSANTDYFSAEVGLARGFGRFEDYMLTPEHLVRSAALGRTIGRNPRVRHALGLEQMLARKNAPEVSRAFTAWIASLEPRTPWFAMLNYYDAHRPYQAPEPFNSRFAPAGIAPDPRFRMTDDPENPWQPDEIEGHIAAYEGAIAYLDTQVRALLDDLGQRGILSRTVVIVTSDHGEEFGEHGLFDHGNSLYLPSLHVPLVIAGPGIPAGRRVGTPVSLRDVTATVLDATGASSSGFPGESLSRHWRSSRSAADELLISAVRRSPGHPDSYPVTAGDMVGLMRGTLRYVKNLGSGREEMYDVREDPWERRDLLGDPGRRLALDRFRADLTMVEMSTGGLWK